MADNQFEKHMKTLGLSHGFTESELKAAHRKAVRMHHPDAGGDSDKMVAANLAMEYLRKSAKPSGSSTPSAGPTPSKPAPSTVNPPPTKPAPKPAEKPAAKPTMPPPPPRRPASPGTKPSPQARPAASGGSLTLSTGTPPPTPGAAPAGSTSMPPKTTQAAPASQPRPTRPETTRIAPPPTKPKRQRTKTTADAPSGNGYPNIYSAIHDSIFQKKSSLSAAQKSARRPR